MTSRRVLYLVPLSQQSLDVRSEGGDLTTCSGPPGTNVNHPIDFDVDRDTYFVNYDESEAPSAGGSMSQVDSEQRIESG